MGGHINKYVGADNVQDRGAAVDNGGTGAASNGATGVVQLAMVPLVWCSKQWWHWCGAASKGQLTFE